MSRRWAGGRRWLTMRLAAMAAVVAMSGCAGQVQRAEPTPTIVMIPEETRNAVRTAEVEALARPFVGTPTPIPPAGATGTVAAISTATATTGLEGAEVTGTSAPEVPAATGSGQHVVQPGESLTHIARAYGLTVEQLLAANDIANPSVIQVGQVLVIPAGGLAATETPTAALTATEPPTATAAALATPAVTPAPTATSTATATALPTTIAAATASPSGAQEHVVELGENLSMIARVYGVTVAEIIAANSLPDPSTIQPGQVLVIPSPRLTLSPQVSPSATPIAVGTADSVIGQALGAQVAFQVASGGPIWLVNADGTGLRQVATGLDPALSPDGRRLAYAQWQEPRGLYVIDLGLGGTQLVRGSERVKSPAWSPDGSAIGYSWEMTGATDEEICFPGFGCFSFSEGPQWGLRAVNLAGETVGDPAADLRSFSPTWASDGTWYYQGERALMATTLNGQAQTVRDDGAITCPSVSPDGSALAVMYYQHDHWEIHVISSDGRGQRRLTQASPFDFAPAENVAPTWSPDGGSILFLSNRDGHWRPYIMAADGSDQRPFLPAVMDQFIFDYQFAAERVFSWR